MSVKRYQPVAQCVEPSYQAQMIVPKVMEFSEGEYVRWEDYDATCETLAHTETERDASDAEVERLKAEVERLEQELEQRCRELNLSLGQQAVQLRQIGDLKAQLEHIDLLKSVVEKFINSADLKNPLDTQSHCAITEKLKQLPDCILDFTEEQVRDNPAWVLAVFRHKVKEMQYKRVHDLNAIGGEQEENARLQAEVERLTDALNKLVKTPPEATGGVRVKVDFWTQYGSRLPSSYETFWENAAKEGKPSV